MAKKTRKKREPKPESQYLLLRRRLPEDIGGKVAFVSWQMLLLLLCCGALSLCTLWLSYCNFSPMIFNGYFEVPLIAGLNFALPTALCLLLFAVIGRAWIAYLITAVVSLSIAIGNYYLVQIRGDPLHYEDLTCIREALAITDSQGYDIHLDVRVIMSLLSSAVLTVVLFFLSRWRLRFSWPRLIGLALACIFAMNVAKYCKNSESEKKTKYYKYIDTWSTTQIYSSRGVLYSFFRTAMYGNGMPEGYKEAQAAAEYARFTDAPIPEDRKVDLIVVMRESYSDLSDLGCTDGSIDFSCYDIYHALAAESMVGELITNGFGGGTKDTERGFLTGNFKLTEWRKPVNSYVWYLRTQGYAAEGAHPFNGWFYNRRNINRYLGFQNYIFREDGLGAMETKEDTPIEDDVLYDQLWQMYQNRDSSRPYFQFSVTFEGHGPYHVYHDDSGGRRYVRKGYGTTDGVAMNNYLACVAKRDEALKSFVDRLRSSDRPVVLLTYGDHKATLGKDVNNYTTAAYKTYGMDVSLGNPTGFQNHYSTEYLIWMNDAAKEVLGMDPAGMTGPTISPCYLMNVLFKTLGWGDGPAYLQLMGQSMDQMPVICTKGRVFLDGEMLVPDQYSDLPIYKQMQINSYYWRTHFFYREVQ